MDFSVINSSTRKLLLAYVCVEAWSLLGMSHSDVLFAMFLNHLSYHCSLYRIWLLVPSWCFWSYYRHSAIGLMFLFILPNCRWNYLFPFACIRSLCFEEGIFTDVYRTSGIESWSLEINRNGESSARCCWSGICKWTCGWYPTEWYACNCGRKLTTSYTKCRYSILFDYVMEEFFR